jgi:PAS domain S-box-containing protein
MQHELQNKSVPADKRQGRSAEAERRFTDAEIQPYLDAVVGIYAILDHEGKVLFVNRRGREILGYPDAEIVGKNWFDRFLQKTVAEESKSRFQGILAGEAEAGGSEKYPIITKSGEERIIAWQISAIRNQAGNPIAAVWSGEDVTDFTEKEQALQKQYGQLRTVIEHLPNAIFIKDATARKVLANRADLVNMGLETEAEAMSKTDFDVFPEEIAARCYADDQTVLQTGQSILNREEILVNKNGQKRWLSTFKMPLRDEKGQIIGLFGMARDITERRQTEKALRDSELFLSAIFNSIQDGISVLASDLTILHVNDIMKQWYAQNLPLEGKKCHECYHNAMVPCVPCPTLRCLQTGKTEREIVPGLPGSSLEWLELYSYPMKDPETGKIFGVVEFVRDITERKRVEEALRASEEKFRSIVETTGEWIWEMDVEGRMTYNNPSLGHILGYRLEEQLGRDTMELMHEEDCDKIKKELPEWIAAKCGWNGRIIRWRHQDGTYRWLESNGKPILNNQGELVGFRGSDRDITERVKAEEALRQSEMRFRDLTENTSDWIWEVDAEMRYIYASPRIQELLGYAPEEILGKTPYDLMPPTEAERVRQLIDDVKKNPRAFRNLENINLHKDGSNRVIGTSGVPVYDAQDQFSGFRGIDRDITERKQAEIKLRESEERYRSLTEAAHDMIFILDRDGRIEYINSFGAAQFKKKPEEIMGKFQMDFFPSGIAQRHMNHIKRIFDTSEPFFVEAPSSFLKSSRWLGTWLVPLKDDHGQVKNVLGIARDFTERKQMEDQIRADIREKDVLLKEIHHRVKNNMQVISSLLNLQSGLVKEEEYRRMFRESQARIRSMAMVHEQLYQTKNLTRIDFGKYSEQLTKELLQTFGASVRGIRMKIQISSVLLNINTAIPCGLIVNELVTNALKHAFPMKSASGVSKSKTENQIVLRMAKTKIGWKLSVRDNGSGIPKNVDIQESQSIGMKIVYALVDQLGGKIRMENKAGTAFHIVFRDKAVGQ